jgi:hypothetical protein
VILEPQKIKSDTDLQNKYLFILKMIEWMYLVKSANK